MELVLGFGEMQYSTAPDPSPSCHPWCNGVDPISLLCCCLGSVYTGLVVLATACSPGNGHLLPRERVGEQDAPPYTTDAPP